MFKLISLIRDKIGQTEDDFHTLAFPAFVVDTRSSPIEVRFELDVRNDRNMAAWKQRWRFKAFEEGRYGMQPIEETVSVRRPAVGNRQKAGGSGEKPAESGAGKVLRLNGPLAA